MIIAAHEAAKITTNSIQQDLNLQLEIISKAITKAAANGKFELDWDGYLDPKIRKCLQAQGYHLKDWQELNKEYTTIDWRYN